VGASPRRTILLWLGELRARMLGSVMGLLRRRIAWIASLGALAAALTVPWSVVVAAQPNQLSAPTVSPTKGETTTTFSFSVRYVGRHPATSVTVVVGPRTIRLALTAGTASDGTYAGSSQLPAGTWPVTFNAVAAKGNPPTISGGTVTVAGPTPSPKPSVAPTRTSAPTAAATLAPAPVTKTTTPSASTTTTSGGGGAVSRAAATPVPAAAAAATPGTGAAALAESTDDPNKGAGVVASLGGHDLVPAAFWPVMLAGFGIIGLFVAWYAFVMERDRRRHALAAEMALAAQRAAMAAPAATEPERTPAVWELDSRLEDAPIGTVEYLPLENGAAIGALPEALSESERPRRGNQRLARLSNARTHRHMEDRRSLLRRS
jgi:hypothetical protein